MTRSRGNSSASLFSARNVARVVVTGLVVAGAPLALSGTANAATDETWDQIARCESGGRWNTNTGNGYSGGLQFAPSTWRAHGGQGNAANASRAAQIAVAERVLASQGWGAWPACSRKVGARGGATPRTVPVTQRPLAQRPLAQRPSSQQSARTAVKPPAAKPTIPAPRVPAAPGVAGTPQAVPVARYVVAPGDSLAKIAKMKNVQGGWQSLHTRNKDKVANPSTIKVGQELDIN